MKVIKNKYIKFPSLEDSIGRLGVEFKGNSEAKNDYNDFDLSPAEQQKRIRFFFVMNKLNAKFDETFDPEKILEYLQTALKEIIILKSSFFFVFDENSHLKPVSKTTDKNYTSFINKAYQNGILDWMFETKKISVLPDITRREKNTNALSLLVIPLFMENKPYGLYAIATPIASLSSKTYESDVLKMFLALAQSKIEHARQQERISAVYDDLQTLQSKLSNDYKFSAIGELTAGIVEDVMSPVQVILSCTNFIEKEFTQVDKKLTGAITSQIKKIENVIKRLSKFVGAQPTNGNLYPTIINEQIQDYYEVVLSSLKYNNYECILDLDNNLPPIMTQKSYIHQLLTNLFGMVLNSNVEGGGILGQTKFVSESISLRFIVTDRLNIYAEDNNGNKANLNVKMIANIMKRHQGDVKIINNESGGTTIILNFPVKRKLSK